MEHLAEMQDDPRLEALVALSIYSLFLLMLKQLLYVRLLLRMATTFFGMRWLLDYAGT